jgi:hypothetical protein
LQGASLFFQPLIDLSPTLYRKALAVTSKKTRARMNRLNRRKPEKNGAEKCLTVSGLAGQHPFALFERRQFSAKTRLLFTFCGKVEFAQLSAATLERLST